MTTTVHLTHWIARVPLDGSRERWTLEFEGKPVLTFGREFEARKAAHKNGWGIDEDGGEMRQWDADHPGGFIPDDELEAIDQYGTEAGRFPERVLIYGSRDWIDSDAIRDTVFLLPKGSVVIHGGARGADQIAGIWARHYGLEEIVFPANWAKDGKAAGPIRNQRMIDEGKSTRAYGFRMPGESRGTDDMTRRLVADGIPHEVTAAPAAPLVEGGA